MPTSDTVIINILHSNIRAPASHVILEVINAYGVALNRTQVEKVQLYVGLLLLWNQKLSLTSIIDLREILHRHFGESLFASKFIEFGSSRLADVGSGAGFPGLALKIVAQELQVFLIEQHTKKCAFLNEAVRLLDLSSVRVVRSPYEALPPAHGNFDFITSRAVGNHKRLLKWAQSRLGLGGRAVLWLGSADAANILTTPGWAWDPPYPIPNSRNNVIVTGRYSQ
jgi:16S rRNA (guanine527-N7)-methyltransferase